MSNSNRVRSSSNIRCPTCANEFNVKIEEEHLANDQITHNVIIAAPLVSSGHSLGRSTSLPVTHHPGATVSSLPETKPVLPLITNPLSVSKQQNVRPILKPTSSNASESVTPTPSTSMKSSGQPKTNDRSTHCPLHQVPYQNELHVQRASRIGRHVQRMRSRSKKRLLAPDPIDAFRSKEDHSKPGSNSREISARDRIRIHDSNRLARSLAIHRMRSRSQRTQSLDEKRATAKPIRPNQSSTAGRAKSFSTGHDLLWILVFWLHVLCLLSALADASVFLRRRSELAWQTLDMNMSDWLRACGERDLQLFILQLGTFVLRALEAAGAVSGCLTGNRLILALTVLLGPLQLLIGLTGSVIDVFERAWSTTNNAESGSGHTSTPAPNSTPAISSNWFDTLVQSLLLNVLVYVMQCYAFAALVIYCVRQNGGLFITLFEPVNQLCSIKGNCPGPLQGPLPTKHNPPTEVLPVDNDDPIDSNNPHSSRKFVRPEVRHLYPSNRSSSFDQNTHENQ